MSFLSEVEAELGRAEDALKARFRSLAGSEVTALADDVKAAVSAAKDAALAAVEQGSPASAPEVSKALDAVVQAVLGAVEKHLIP